MPKPKVVFDSEAILTFYLGEKGSEFVKDLLDTIQKGGADGFLNIINLAEVYYILYRADPEIAEEKEESLRLYGLKIMPVDDDAMWREASKIKAKYTLSLADAFAAATAKTLKAKLIVGSDEEFKKIGVALTAIRKNGK